MYHYYLVNRIIKDVEKDETNTAMILNSASQAVPPLFSARSRNLVPLKGYGYSSRFVCAKCSLMESHLVSVRL